VKPPDSSTSRSTILDRFRTLFNRNTGHARLYNYEPQHRGTVISVCLLSSTLLWLIFSMREMHSIPIELPTQISSLPPSKALTVLPPHMVRVQIRGEGIQLLRLYYDPPTLPIDASLSEVSLDAVVADLTKNVSVENVLPHTFVVHKEERVSKLVPIRSRVSVETGETYDLIKPVCLTPDSLSISGARSIVENIDAWPTKRRVFQNVRDTLDVKVLLADSLEGLVLRDVNEIEVTAVSEEFTEGEREIKVLVPGAPLGEEYMSLSPPTIMVRYLVPISQYDAAHQAEDFFATVSYDVIRADTTGRVSPRLHLPANLVLREIIVSPPTLGYYNVLVDER